MFNAIHHGVCQCLNEINSNYQVGWLLFIFMSILMTFSCTCALVDCRVKTTFFAKKILACCQVWIKYQLNQWKLKDYRKPNIFMCLYAKKKTTWTSFSFAWVLSYSKHLIMHSIHDICWQYDTVLLRDMHQETITKLTLYSFFPTEVIEIWVYISIRWRKK